MRLFSIIWITFFLTSCAGNKEKKSYTDYSKRGIFKIFNFDSLIQIKPVVGNYVLSIYSKKKKGIELKKKIWKNGDKLIEEWVSFDESLFLKSINLALVDLIYLKKENKLKISGNLFTTLNPDKVMYLISKDTSIICFENFQDNYSFNYVCDGQKNIGTVNIEIIQIKKNDNDSSITTYSIHKKFKLSNGIPKAEKKIILEDEDSFSKEKFKIFRRLYQQWW